MDSRYKFRGKRVDNGEWVEGNLIVNNARESDGIHEAEPMRTFIREQSIGWKNDPNDKRWTFSSYEVIPESVGQYTGRQDMNEVEIYDKDIVKLCYGIPPTFDTLLIEYADDETVGDISVSGWWMRNIRPNGVSGSLCKTYENDLEIIGNATDNPELLTEKSHA